MSIGEASKSHLGCEWGFIIKNMVLSWNCKNICCVLAKMLKMM